MLSELAIIERIARIAATRPGVAVGIGDDAAVLDGLPVRVVTQDLVVDGVHFRRATHSMGDIGHTALAVNLSDVAAMGADPVAAVVGLGLPDHAPLAGVDIDAMFEAMEQLAAMHGMTLAGGDVSRAPVLLVAVTAIGEMATGVPPLLRTGARAGDLLCVTGTIGAAAAGRRLLEDPRHGSPFDELRIAARHPTPRVAAGRILAAGGASAMLDCSDGLALDVDRLARASGVAITLDLAQVPVAEGVSTVADAEGVPADLFAATGGDDYELIVTVPPEHVAGLTAALDVPLTAIGRVENGSPGLTVRRDGATVVLDRLGWEHTPGSAATR